MTTEMIMVRQAIAESTARVTQRIDDLQRATWNKALNEVADKLYERNEMYLGVLQNGRPIFEQTTGARFDKMYEQRRKLYDRMKSLDIVWSIIQEVRDMQK